MKITIYALHLGVGGVEKYVSTLANILIEISDVKIISTYKLENSPSFYIDPRVKIEYLLLNDNPNKDKIIKAIREKNIFNLIKEGWIAFRVISKKWIKNIFSVKTCQSDIIISTRIFHNRIISRFAKKSIIKIATEHNHHNNDEKYINNLVNSCKGFDYFIPISKYLSDYYTSIMSKNGVKTKYIRFCVDDIPNQSRSSLHSSNIISVGRFSPEKGFNDLIDVFTIVNKINNKIILNLIGDGNEREFLENKVKEKNLSQNVIFHGFQNKEYVYTQLTQNSLYVMTSYTESFGLVLLEAMSCGLPCISFSTANGAKEIIDNNKNGILVPNRDKRLMAIHICKILKNKLQLKEMSDQALKTAELYNFKSTKQEWQKFILSIKED